MRADDICFCGQSREWHEKNSPRHTFRTKDQEGERFPQGTLPGDKKKNKVEGEVKTVQGFGGDPVLRLALINKGVLRAEDLSEAEGILNAARAAGTIAIAQPASSDAGSRPGVSDASGGTVPNP